jgi:hypothetical protein
MNTKTYTQEIQENRIQFGHANEEKRLLSGKGIHYLSWYVINHQEFEEVDIATTAQVYGMATEGKKNGDLACFYVTYNWSLWRRNTLIEVGELLTALQEEYRVNESLKEALNAA